MADIVLSTLNAKYRHAAFGLRYLLANLGPLQARAVIEEFDVHQRPLDIAEALMRHKPRIVGLGAHIWNVTAVTEVAATLKRLRPDLTLVLGGPEVSFETAEQRVTELADYIITGEADVVFRQLCETLLAEKRTGERFHGPPTATICVPEPLRPLRICVEAGRSFSAETPRTQSPKAGFMDSRHDFRIAQGGHEPERLPADSETTAEAACLPIRSAPVAESGKRFMGRVIAAAPPEFAELVLPYDLYTADDLAHRVVYVEASRGCPFRCEFCLSSLDVPVRAAPLPEFLAAMQRLLDRGATQLKFVDRTFNLNLATSRTVLEFCLAQWRPGRFFHFEVVPDRLPSELREVIAKFPPGALQFEVGVQTFNPEVAARIGRRQDYAELEDNLRWLRRETSVHVHADLIFGLPGETLASFAAGFDRLVALGPQEIQVGILKRLRGTPIVRHDAEWAVVWNPQPPYELLQNRLVDFATLQRLRRLARVWDLVGNSGNFVETAPLIWSDGTSPFGAFLRWSDWLFAREGRTDSIALPRLMECLFEFLTREQALSAEVLAATLLRDFSRAGRRDAPAFLCARLPEQTAAIRRRPGATSPTPERQARHLARGT